MLFVSRGPLINVLTRTYRRPTFFEFMRSTLYHQSYLNWKHLVSVQGKCDYTRGIPVKLKRSAGSFPANLHMNVLLNHVKDGWVLYMDDDDCFMSPDAISHIVSHIEHEDQFLIWHVSFGCCYNRRTRQGIWTCPDITPKSQWPKRIRLVPKDLPFGKGLLSIPSCSFLYHSKHKVKWNADLCGDRHVYFQLMSKGLEKVYIDAVLTGRQWKGNGRASDK